MLHATLRARYLRKGATPARATLWATRDRLRIEAAHHTARIVRTEGTANFPTDDPRPVAIFSHFESAGTVADSTLAYLEALRTVASAIVFVTTSGDLTRVRHLADLAILRTNVGYDFGSWKVGLTAAHETITTQGIILANDSVYGPRRPLAPIVERMTPSPFWGMTDSHEITPHLQSYFLSATPTVTTSHWFQRFWKQVRHVPNAYKFLIVRCYEIGLSELATSNQITPTAAYPIETFALPNSDLTTLNPTQNYWRELATHKTFPFLKKGMRRPENRKKYQAGDIEEVISQEFGPPKAISK